MSRKELGYIQIIYLIARTNYFYIEHDFHLYDMIVYLLPDCRQNGNIFDECIYHEVNYL